MNHLDTLRILALSLPETTEELHFEKPSFRVKKKIFATYHQQKNSACIKLSEIDQSVFSTADKNHIYPVEGKWGKQGWTMIELDKIDFHLLEDAIKTAYCEVAPKKLSETIQYNNKEIN